jgi:hypothetical protein
VNVVRTDCYRFATQLGSTRRRRAGLISTVERFTADFQDSAGRVRTEQNGSNLIKKWAALGALAAEAFFTRSFRPAP